LKNVILAMVFAIATCTIQAQGPDKDQKIEKAAGADKATGDPINAARTALADVERAESDVMKSFGELRRRLMEFNPAVAKNEKETLDCFRLHLEKMQMHGKRLLDAEPEFNAAVRKYDKALQKAPGEYRQAVQRYAKMAQDEKYEDLKKDYADLAKASQE